MSYTYEELKDFVKKVRPYVEGVEITCEHLGVDTLFNVLFIFHSIEARDALLADAPMPHNGAGEFCVIAYKLHCPLPDYLLPVVTPNTTETGFVLQMLAQIKKDLGVVE